MDQPTPSHGSRWTALLAILAVSGSAVGGFIYQSWQGNAKTAQDNTGFDLSQTDSRPKSAPLLHPRAASARDQSSGLSLVKADMPGMEFGAKSAAPASQRAVPAEKSFAQLIRAQEAKMRALNKKYTAKYPVIAQFRKEWLGNPGLKRLRDDFCGSKAGVCGPGGDHDPVKFIRGVAASQAFKSMLIKYAGEPAVHSYVMEAVKQAPSNLMAAASDFMSQDNNVKNFIDGVAQSLGLPMGLLEGSDSKVDQNAILGSIMKNNPELQKAMENADAPKR
ncbi:MAG: hypothetical protein A3J74_04560 [Elusimicrobia bacterium RIFCSPHIGHO2_02_FULL_57_9]|nr:MAG: hypothetical protein A3J74_04560 [Elusimicrobia bacterium RIFCSPHIGHO2_02_FULL_57_9]